MIKDNEIYDAVYQYMSLKSIGPVQTNKVLNTVSEPMEPYYLKSQLKNSLNSNLQIEFEKAPSVLDNLNSKFDVGFLLFRQ